MAVQQFESSVQLEGLAALSPETVEVDDDDESYTLGYLLEWTSYRYVTKSLEWAAEQGIIANPKFIDVHSEDLAAAVSGYASEIRPTSLETAIEVRNEIIHRILIMPKDHEVDVEVHLLLSGVSWADGYVRMFAEDEHARQQG